MPLASDPVSQLARARVSLDGLSIGDAFGQRFFGPPGQVAAWLEARRWPEAPWRVTDDTEMAVALVQVLELRGGVDRDFFADALVRRYRYDSGRGYGGGAHQLLGGLSAGLPWDLVSRTLFDGSGSKGNGAAMRVAPLGAYFADDFDLVVQHAKAQAEVTHAHPEGQAGAIAVAVAAACSWRARSSPPHPDSPNLLAVAEAHTPPGPTRDGLSEARRLAPRTSAEDAARALGSGQRVLSEDTVPFALWSAQQHGANFAEALWQTVAGLGDRDTTCAMVGGVVATSAADLPPDWLAARERLRFDQRLASVQPSDDAR
jgi:ADP-ribosylglycohydrolase